MEQRYSQGLIDRTKLMYQRFSGQQLSDSDVIECIDNMSSLINYLATLQDKISDNPQSKDAS